MPNPVYPDTPQLIRRAVAGQQEGFAALFERYKNLVYRTAYLVLGNSESAEDALQEVFLQVYRSLASYDPQRAAFSTWLYRITLNYCLNHRRRRRLEVAPLDEQFSNGEFPGAQNEHEAVWQAVHSLSDKQRAVVVLRYYWGLSYAEISQILEIPLGTVKSRFDLALKTLRLKLDEEFQLSPALVEDVNDEL